MIIQGSNLPIIITFDENDGDVSTFSDISIIIYPRENKGGSIIKSWKISDVIIDGQDVICPINQEDFMEPNLIINSDLNIAIEIKWLADNAFVYNTKTVYDFISYRKDNSVLSGV